ncbi:PQQ-binding-like beta-propeller repeat protein [Streptomyces albipurpureus]|uniref:PQQ-binding-like beta-propeller repeat protein n=1 Tax=Streptomyces albipurpureus TaxID=2897419 RepID=A0ABT0UJA3_9ACTN|nr:PQQ-binding-like beta-propeller repeat protein [Streptomyces sp. CWNU-1]MCM2387503.1 PQQ-binding-like beta-propeller repeat protein [Streptomyces sp. CWNU-1]
MQTDVIAAPADDMGRVVVDQPLDTSLTVKWQRSLADFDVLTARLHTVSGVAILTFPKHGMLSFGTNPPDMGADVRRWPVPTVHIAGTAYGGQLMVIDDWGTVYRVSPDRAPVPGWRSGRHPEGVGVVGLPGGLLLVSDTIEPATEVVEEATGQTLWCAAVDLCPDMLVGDSVVGVEGPTSSELISLDVRTGEVRWQRRGSILPPSSAIAVVAGVLWFDDPIHNRLVGFHVDTGRPAGTVVLPRESRLTGTLDQAGHLHIGDEHGWLIVDLARARVRADVRFEASDMGAVYASRTRRSADGRLVLADDRGQVFVVRPDRPRRPVCVATLPAIKGIGIAAGQLIVLSYDGTLSGLGAPS